MTRLFAFLTALVMPGILAGTILGGDSPASPVSPARPGAVPSLLDPRRPLDRELELSIADGFTLAAVGDCIISRPLSPLLGRDPAFAGVVDLLKRADVTFGNLETTILDIRSFRGHPFVPMDDWPVLAVPGVAQDLRAMGFDIMARANNHTMDWGIEGMRETGDWLDRAGIVHAGAGEDRGRARAPRYVETPKGRIALVSIASGYQELSAALPPHGQAPGRPGISALRTRRITVVSEAIFTSLVRIDEQIRAGIEPCPLPPLPDGTGLADAGVAAGAAGGGQAAAGAADRRLSLFGSKFRPGARPGNAWEVDPIDMQEILQSVRLGKQHADLLIATLHSHESDLHCDDPGDFVPILARQAIDAGADLFVVHGIHQLGPIEIYKGRPIFYGMANFFWSDILEPLPANIVEGSRDAATRAFGDAARATDADITALANASYFADERVFQAILATIRFDRGRAAEIALHPVDLGYGRRLTESGVPRLASATVGRTILERIQAVSRPYGTTIAIEKNIGVIRFGGKP